MKKYIFAILAAASLMSAVSCEKFLTTEPSSSVSDTQVFVSLKGAQAALNGCYYLLFFDYGSRADTQGYISQIMTFDVDGEDIIVNGGWYGYDYNMWGHQRGDIFKAYALWNYYYNIINNLNSIICYTPQIDGATEAETNPIVGEALAMRGWAYFNLAQLFQQTYVLAHERNMPGVPIYTEPTTDQTEGKSRGTIDDTYDQIISDLTLAEEYLQGATRSAKNHFDKDVVNGLLARVYLVRNEWDKAAAYAAKARSGYPLTSNEDWNSGFNNIDTKSWMWGMMVDEEHTLDANGDYGPFAMWTNYITRDGGDFWSFNCFYLNDLFAELFSADDIRGQQIYYDADKGLHCSKKFYDTVDLTGDFCFMRADEMLLIEAECASRQGDDVTAATLLNELRTLRGATPTSTIGSSLLEEILTERRKELYGEGFAWYDIIRTQKGLTRQGNHSNFGGAVVVPPRSWRFVYQIPTNEILNNPNINSDLWPAGDQNPFGDPSLCLD